MSFKHLPLALLMLAALTMGCSRMDSGKQIEEAFLNPPESSHPWNYWYWINENISKEGITKDLEAMAQAGIGAALIGNVTDGSIPIGDTPLLSEKWWDMMVHAVREGKRTGVKIGMFNCPGWSQSGGPWVTPGETMRYLASSEIKVAGPQKLAHRFTDPETPFQPLYVQAFRNVETGNKVINTSNYRITSDGINNLQALFDGNRETIATMPNEEATIEFFSENPFPVRSFLMYPAGSVGGNYMLEYQDSDNNWHTLIKEEINRASWEISTGFMKNPPVAEAFPELTAKRLRLFLSHAKGAQFSEIQISDDARLSKFIEKQLAKMASHPYIKGDTYEWAESIEPEDPASKVYLKEVIDLSDKIDSTGLLTWDVPEGDWVILRTGMTPTGITNSPTMPTAQGLEIDKMNRDYAESHFEAHIGELLRRLTPEEKTAFSYVVADSYEKGAQNWTDGLAEDFQKRYGYDPYPWFPVLTGRVIESADLSERFLWDLRRIVADRISSDYVGGLREKSAENNMKLWLENYGHWGYPGEFLSYGGASDLIGGEFWLSDPNLGPVECRCASSAGHIYGKEVISAEAFTSGWTYNKMPRDFKARGDWCVTEGINHFVLHLYIHQPDDRKPGINAWFGTDFNRNTTWYGYSSEYFNYLKRLSAMLQQGATVADVAYFIGEDVPKMTGTKDPELAKGYDYDFINAEVLLMESTTVKNGRIQLGSGASYAIMVLPNQETMRPETLEKIARLVKDGATIMGPEPVRSPSARNYPKCDQDVQRIAREVWGEAGKGSVTENIYGKGRVYAGIDLDQAFMRMGLVPDVVIPDGYLYTHRRAGTSDIYFVTNQEEKSKTNTISFRATGMQPELWDPVSGEMRALENFTIKDGQTHIPLEFGPTDAWFIVFRNKTGKTESSGENFPKKEVTNTIAGPWNVAFDTALDAPANIEFTDLTDWITNNDPAIKYYSGEAVYTTDFTFSGDLSKENFIDLGRVETMASVKLNGEDLGILWRYPYTVPVKGKLKEGSNKLEVTVINYWWNRLVGDKQPGAAKKYTYSTVQNWNASSELLSSGLMGPVTVQTK